MTAPKLTRAVGYCTNENIPRQVSWSTEPVAGCEDFAKGMFLLNHGDVFHCPRCGCPGLIVPESGEAQFVSAAEGPDGFEGVEPYWHEVRVEYSYVLGNGYRELAIVKDLSLGFGNVYTIRSPLVKTEKRALKIAEQVLANLNRMSRPELEEELKNAIPRTSEFLFSYDLDGAEREAQRNRLERYLMAPGAA